MQNINVIIYSGTTLSGESCYLNCLIFSSYSSWYAFLAFPDVRRLLISFLLFPYLIFPLLGRNKLRVINNLSEKRWMKMYCLSMLNKKRGKSFSRLFLQFEEGYIEDFPRLFFTKYMHAHWYQNLFAILMVNKNKIDLGCDAGKVQTFNSYKIEPDILENICLNINFCLLLHIDEYFLCLLSSRTS